MSETITEERQLTFGEQLCGVTFNPSKDPKVDRAKELCAELTDLLYDGYKNSEISVLKRLVMEHALGEILNAQMNVVKLLTLKY